MAKPTKKCVHGREEGFCCICNYGDRSYAQDRGVNTEKDVVDQMNMRDSFRMMRGFAMIGGD